LKREQPEAEIDALVMFGGVNDIYKRTGLFSKIHHFDFLEKGAVKSLRFVLSLRKKYDVSISVYPANRREYNIINFLIGAKKRCGVDYKRMNRVNFGFLNNVTVPEYDDRHNAQTNIALVEKLLGKELEAEPGYLFPLLPEDMAFANEFISMLPEGIIIGFHPGCATLKNHIKRRWEPEKFSELGKRLISEQNAVVLIFGGPDEKELKEKVRAGIDSERAFAVETKNLAQSAAVIKKCDLFVTNDSSLMHTASAMKTKTAALIGPTNTAYIHPWHTEYKIVSLVLDCAPCFFYSPKPLQCSREDVQYKCIRELSVEKVYSVVTGFLQGN
jgi:heptosyltransferase-2